MALGRFICGCRHLDSSGSPAAKAGLRVGDIITAIDGRAVADSADVITRISPFKPGDSVTLTLERGGSRHQASVTLGTLS